jgi:hypothetical protein
MIGLLPGSRGSVPNTASITSWKPSRASLLLPRFALLTRRGVSESRPQIMWSPGLANWLPEWKWRISR